MFGDLCVQVRLVLVRLCSHLPQRVFVNIECIAQYTRPSRPVQKYVANDKLIKRDDDMKAAIKSSEFIETATFSGNMYGTR